MVGDMLTAPEDPTPPSFTPMEESGSGPPSARCSIHHGASLPPAGSHSSDEGRLRRRSGFNVDSDVPEESRMKESKTSSEDVRVWNPHQQTEIQSVMSCKRKLEMSSVLYHDSTKSRDSGSHAPESPPPVKRWLIGPLIQNFKSKMASFTEIVMSPVQLFKPIISDRQTSANPKGSGDGGDQTARIGLQKEPLNSFLSSSVVQRLRYDTTSSNGSDAEEKPATGSSESPRVSIPPVNISPGTPSKVEEPVDGHDPLTVCRSSQKTMCVKVPRLNHLKLHHTGSEVQQSPGKGLLCSPSSPLVTKSLVVLCERSEYTTSVMSPGQERKCGGQEAVKVSARKYDGKRRKVATSILHNKGGGEEPSSKRALRSKQRVLPANCRSPKSAYAKDSPSATPTKMSKDVKSKATRQCRTSVKGKKTDILNGNQKNHADSERSSGCLISTEPKFTRRRKSGLVKLTPAPKQQNTGAGGRGIQEYDGPGMAMSLTLKVGSGEGEVVPIVSCGIARIEAKHKERRSCESKTLASHSYNGERLRNGKDECWKSDILDIKEQRRVVSLNRSRPAQDPDESKTSAGLTSNQLKRSFSCPDISSLQHGSDGGSEAGLNHTPLLHRSPLKRPPHVQQVSPLKRERRHTVCSIEIEREFAPLCLRKEVYPNLGFSSSHTSPRSPGKSLTDLVSGFLSSPLAFLSKKSVCGRNDDSGYVTSSGELVRSSSSPSFSKSPTSSFTSGPVFITDTTCTPEESSILSHSSVFSGVLVEVDDVVAEKLNDEKCPAVLEEKALSDSEIKTNKQEERRKVSSIRIRKTLPKPQNNLTPMGLPKAVRIKKKVFSVEEIYTNKNYSKPPEGRLETIFEVPLDRRDGSQSLFGQKRMKRVVDFPELGVPRKPKRPPISGVGGGGAQRKAAGSSVTGRTRRGVWASSREEAALLVQDFDSLLCSKLNELDCWMAVEQVAY